MTGPSLIRQYDYFISAAGHRRSVASFPVSAVRSLPPYSSTYRMSYRQFLSPYSATLAKSATAEALLALMSTISGSFSTRDTEISGLAAGLYSVVCDTCFVARFTVCRNDVVCDRKKRL